MSELEVWGGIECTIARIGDTYRDQFAETGHHDRFDDLDAVARLGIRTIRYPVLWEAFSPDIVQGRGWDWHDRRLNRLRELGIDLIVGLVHHGSGPRDTNLLDPEFAVRLADHARAVAERYPWIRRYTPVNEPLTTARFSALYGHWYPHRKSLADFLRALVNQCRATTLAMAAIRRINPAAELVQTEDIGRVFSTADLAHQADHENHRRWLSLDLLTGRVRPDHPLWPLLLDSGIDQGELEAFWPVRAPDVIGINHYLTSDRYLDSDRAPYPATLHGGNGREAYADAEAVRIATLEGRTGPLARIREVAERFAIPLIVSEVHHGCTRDEQLRWLNEVWTASLTARQEGIDIRAVTIWSLFGAVDWNSTLTRHDGIYEPGAFDTRGGVARETALARATRALAATGRFDHPALTTPAWWHRPERFYDRTETMPIVATGPALVIRGEAGPFLDEWVRIAELRGLTVRHAVPDLLAPRGGKVSEFWAVIDLGAGAAPAFASWLDFAADRLLPYVYLSSSDVFNTGREFAAVEGDLPSPNSRAGGEVAGREAAALNRHPEALVVRAASLIGLDEDAWMKDEVLQPTCQAGRFSYVPDLIHVTLDLLIDGETGIRHLSSGQPARHVPFARSNEMRLATERGTLMPPFESVLARYQDAAR